VEDHSRSSVPRPRKLNSAYWRYRRKGDGEDPGQMNEEIENQLDNKVHKTMKVQVIFPITVMTVFPEQVTCSIRTATYLDD